MHIELKKGRKKNEKRKEIKRVIIKSYVAKSHKDDDLMLCSLFDTSVAAQANLFIERNCKICTIDLHEIDASLMQHSTEHGIH